MATSPPVPSSKTADQHVHNVARRRDPNRPWPILLITAQLEELSNIAERRIGVDVPGPRENQIVAVARGQVSERDVRKGQLATKWKAWGRDFMEIACTLASAGDWDPTALSAALMACRARAVHNANESGTGLNSPDGVDETLLGGVLGSASFDLGFVEVDLGELYEGGSAHFHRTP